MEKLKQQLDRLIDALPNKQEFRNGLEGLYSVYPFNEFEYIISTLLAKDLLTFDDYLEMRDSYMERNSFLYIFEIAGPRTFGESWAQSHLRELVPELTKPSKRLDSGYSGHYDLFLDEKIRIEVKASRAVDAGSDEPLFVKALASDSKKDFWMNFQQVKCACCDVFVWIGVWRDRIRYWILSSYELEHHPDYLPGQHYGNTGEGQLHVRKDNIGDFDGYEVQSNGLLRAIRAAYKRERDARNKRI